MLVCVGVQSHVPIAGTSREGHHVDVGYVARHWNAVRPNGPDTSARLSGNRAGAFGCTVKPVPVERLSVHHMADVLPVLIG